jgi:hypothetical protein
MSLLDSIVYGQVVVHPTEQQFIDKTIFGPRFPWYWQNNQTFNDPNLYSKYLPVEMRSYLEHTNGPFLSHQLLCRAEDPNISHLDRSAKDFSPYYEFFIEIFHRWMSSQKIAYSRIFRANLNLTWYNGFKHTEPHVDHEWPHCNFIMYLNSCDAGQTILWPADFSTSYMSPCVQNTAVSFNQQWHAQRYPLPGTKRIVFVVTYI